MTEKLRGTLVSSVNHFREPTNHREQPELHVMLTYHQRSKHFPFRFAPSLGYMDWETQVVGQVLYLEAEATGIRGTGIGCFFDDLTHRVFGLEGDRFQVLYHFTMGGAVDDPRLRTLPPYQHLVRDAWMSETSTEPQAMANRESDANS